VARTGGESRRTRKGILKSGFADTNLMKAIAVSGLLVLGACLAQAGDLSLPVTGNLLGSVADASGIPQMGATVLLFNKYERLLAKTLTTPDGRFAFAGLPGDQYSVRVSLASFLPAARDKIAVKAGFDSVLEIHLATLFSNIELSYTLPTSSMSNDWKWVLRSSPATRPITRLLDEQEQETSSSAALHPRIFSGTHAMLSINGGDGGLIDSDSTQADLGTGFVVSTNVLGKNQLQVGGTFGQGFGPSAMGLCAIYSRSDSGGLGTPPEVTLTISQLGILGPQLPGSGPSGNAVSGATPVVRDMSLSIYQVADPVEGVHLEYGVTGESVESMQPTSRVSPFARLTMEAGAVGEFIAAYSDGGRPNELSAHQAADAQVSETGATNDDLLSAVNALARLPELSERDGRLELQRTQNFELGYRKTEGSRTWAASAFYEDVSNGRIYVAGNTSALNPNDLLWDGVSTTSAYNIGHYDRNGYVASVNQRVNDSLDATIAYGRMGGFTADAGLDQGTAVANKFLDERDHNVASANVHTRLPIARTQITANYGWVDSGAVIPRHIFTTQNTYISPGLNVIIRQPLPSFFGMPGRLELTADLRNLLAQGYLPMNSGDGRSTVVVQAPRAIRGSLNFIF
jgi:hypothetical protein